MNLERKIKKKLKEDPGLKERGIVCTNCFGELSDIVGYASLFHNNFYGVGEYSIRDYPEKVLSIDYMQNNCKMGRYTLKEYESDAARLKGLITLFSSFDCLAKNIGVNKLVVQTWIFAARPHLLTKKGSIFYNWIPDNLEEHERVVSTLKEMGSLRDYNWIRDSRHNVAGYHKVLGKKKNKIKVFFELFHPEDF